MLHQQESCLLKIGLITDLHYAPGISGSRHYQDSLVKLQDAVSLFSASSLDLVVNLGDSIDKSDTIEEELARLSEVQCALGSVGVYVHYLIGNHDVSEMTKREYLTALNYSSSYFSFDVGDVHVVVLDSNNHQDGTPFSAGDFVWDDAWVGVEQIRWLEDDLATSAGKPVLVFCHGVLNDIYRLNGALNGHVVRDAQAVRSVLESAGSVKGVFMGHHHGGGQVVVNGIPYITLKAMVEGAANEKNAYAILSLMVSGGICISGYGRQESIRYDAREKELKVEANE